MNDIKRVCPICGSEVFKIFRGREFERCTGCHSMGRTRLMAMAIKFIKNRVSNLPVFHFAPEEALQKFLLEKYGEERYIPADFVPEPYDEWSKVPLRRIDLSRPNDFLPKGGIEGLIHSHVLEHIPGSIERIITQMNDAIAPGGFHLFSVPIYEGWYREDMNPNLSDEEKTERFFQYDHIRAFGTNDFEDRCLRLFEKDFTKIDLNISQQDLIKASVGQTAMKKFTGNTPFLFIKK